MTGVLAMTVSGYEIWRSFFSPEVSLFVKIAAPVFAASLIAYLAAVAARADGVRAAGAVLLALGLGLVTASVVERWVEVGNAPLRTMYETFIVTTGTIALMALVYDLAMGARVVTALGLVALVLCLGMAFAIEDKESLPVMPILQSPWFFPHVTAYLLGYASLTIAGVVGMAYLALPWVRFTTPRGREVTLADYAHSLVKVGFVLLTAGLLMGSVWGKAAWGDYWGWDPKEGWSLVTWLIYIAYFHVARRPAWRGTIATGFNVAGAVAVWITFLGTSYLPSASESIHVYAGTGSQAFLITIAIVSLVAAYVIGVPLIHRLRRTLEE